MRKDAWSRDVCGIEALETRLCLSAAIQEADAPIIEGGVQGDTELRITGTSAADTIRVRWKNSQIIIEINDSTETRRPIYVQQVRIDALGGDDRIIIGRYVARSLLLGGAGDDTLTGGQKDDTLKGGDGDDLLDGGRRPDKLFGGAGIDTVDYSGRTDPLNVSLDDAANDGELKERDNVRSDVENINGGRGDDVLTGTGNANRLHGGAGNDALFGGGGPDTLKGGPGEDELLGEDGNDLLDSRDGEVDDVIGGAGQDSVKGDVEVPLWFQDQLEEIEATVP